MDIVVTGRNVEVPDHYRTHVSDKLAKTERYDPKIIRVEVELVHETNRRQSKNCQRVQITLISKGPAVRAESAAENFYAALEGAVDRLESRLRRAAERRHDRRNGRASIAQVAAGADDLLAQPHPSEFASGNPAQSSEAETALETDEYQVEDAEPGQIVRTKDHPGDPISVDDALYRMELVGHDFYLFNDSDSGLPSVVYRRKGFHYGLLRLTPPQS